MGHTSQGRSELSVCRARSRKDQDFRVCDSIELRAHAHASTNGVDIGRQGYSAPSCTRATGPTRSRLVSTDAERGRQSVVIVALCARWYLRGDG